MIRTDPAIAVLEGCRTCRELLGYIAVDALTALHVAGCTPGNRPVDAPAMARRVVSESEWRLMDGNR